MARTDEQRAEIGAAYEAERAAGPDFTRYRSGSGLGDLVPEHQLSRNDRHGILLAFDVIRKGMFQHCRVSRRRPAAQGAADDATRRGMQGLEDDLRKIGADETSIDAVVKHHSEDRARQAAEEGGGDSEQSPATIQEVAPPSRNYRAVLDALLGYAVRFGRVYPKLATIAREAGVGVRTVQNAIDWLRRFGFVERVRRLVRERTRLGGVRVPERAGDHRGVHRLPGRVLRAGARGRRRFHPAGGDAHR
jgi:hypothetical protein